MYLNEIITAFVCACTRLVAKQPQNLCNNTDQSCVAKLLFLLLYLHGKKKGLVNPLYNVCFQIPTFLGFYVWLLIVVKGHKKNT